MKLTEGQLKDLLQEATQEATRMLKKDLVDKIEYEMTDVARTTIKHFVKDWVQDNVIPEVTNRLVASKDGLVASAIPMADAITEGVSQALTEAVKENLSRSYDRKKIFSALFD